MTLRCEEEIYISRNITYSYFYDRSTLNWWSLMWSGILKRPLGTCGGNVKLAIITEHCRTIFRSFTFLYYFFLNFFL